LCTFLQVKVITGQQHLMPKSVKIKSVRHILDCLNDRRTATGQQIELVCEFTVGRLPAGASIVVVYY